MSEHIVAAAIKLDGTIYTGVVHFEALRQAFSDFDADEVRRGVEDNWERTWDEGFVTDKNRFVSRDEAARIAQTTGQKMTHYAPDLNDGTRVFVFGSNLAGRHGAGAALDAVRHWGAINGIGIGRQGMAFAIPTKDKHIITLPLTTIHEFITEFKTYARYHPDLTFLLTRIGCGLAGYTDTQIAPFFTNCSRNCKLPNEWAS